MFLALETGKGTPIAPREKRRGKGETEREREREREREGGGEGRGREQRSKVREEGVKESHVSMANETDGHADRTRWSSGSYTRVGIKVYDHAPDRSQPVPDTILHLALTECRHAGRETLVCRF